MAHTERNNLTYKELLGESWVAWGLVLLYLVLMITNPRLEPVNLGLFVIGGDVLAGILILPAIVMAMNAWALTEMWLGRRPPGWWREHGVMKRLHHVFKEGETAGIAIALIVLACQYARGGLHEPHWEHGHPKYLELLIGSAALMGIMSAGNMAAPRMLPVLHLAERIGGTRFALMLGSLLTSFAGPAAATFLATAFKPRTPEANKDKVVTGIATAQGSGAGLIPYASPAVLIVWAVLRTKFGWGLGELFLFVGVGCILHVVLTCAVVKVYLVPATEEAKDGKRTPITAYWPLLLLTIVVLANMTIELHDLKLSTMVLNLAVAVWALWASLKQDGKINWQPILLGFLLMGLDIVGSEGEPLINAIASLIPKTLPVLLIALLLWWVTAITSHFADNALATRVYIMPAAALAALHGHGNLFAASVLLGGLFGGFVLIPANLLNFILAKLFGITPGAWAKAAWKWYPTCVAHILWLIVIYLMNW